MSAPTLSVIMPVYNTEAYLREAIDSILNQTFTDFELLIFNDGSSDKSADIILSYTDPRIVFYNLKKRVDTTWVANLNIGIESAKGKYIARMDSDDISLPERFAKQVAFMEENPHIGLCTTWLETIGKSYLMPDTPIMHEEIKHYFFFATPIVSASMLLRRDVLIKNNLRYNETYLVSQDTELWIRLIHHTRIQVIPEVLYKYRMHPQQSTRSKNWSAHFTINNKLNYVKSWGVSLSEPDEKHARDLFNPIMHTLDRPQALEALRVGRLIIDKLVEKGFQRGLLEMLFIRHYTRLMNNFSNYSPSLIPLITTPTFAECLSAKSKLKFIAKCLLFKKVAA